MAPMVIVGATNAAVFRAYIKHVLGPTLGPGDIVVLDNLSSHKVPEVEEMILAAGAELWFLPPYSPAMNPIEKMWSKIKDILGGLKARCTEDLYEGVRVAIERITTGHARGWLESCGCRYELS